jgi:Asp-tRNA(Asn)/Glu-tRNA(Gln) amidotransferase A subunit family amidase
MSTDLLASAATESARAIVSALTAGARSSEEVVRACLERIAAVEDDLQAWAFLDPELALHRARELDRRARDERGPLHGVPIGVKDIFDTADQPTAYGSAVYAGARPTRDAAAVARLRAAGAVIIGKTVTTEFALFHPGPTRNPYDLARTPGGSSSGSAAAVAAGCVPLAIGTQTAGSIVRPAAFCGVVGMKPTIGSVPTDGVKPCSHTLDTVGVFARDVDDAALALGVLTGATRVQLGDFPARPAIGFVRTPEWELIPGTTQAVIEDAAARVADVADLVPIELPAPFAGLVDAQLTVMAVEANRWLGPERDEHPGQLSETLRTYLASGPAREAGYEEALALRDRCRAMLGDVFAGVHAVLAPAVLGEAPPVAVTGDPLLCRRWTLLGTPAVAVPGLRGPEGLPVGVQLVGLPGADATVLAAAGWLQRLLAAG